MSFISYNYNHQPVPSDGGKLYRRRFKRRIRKMSDPLYIDNRIIIGCSGFCMQKVIFVHAPIFCMLIVFCMYVCKASELHAKIRLSSPPNIVLHAQKNTSFTPKNNNLHAKYISSMRALFFKSACKKRSYLFCMQTICNT